MHGKAYVLTYVLSFNAENKDVKLIQGRLHFKLNMIYEILHFLKFQEFINELGKICFSLGKIEF